MTQDLTIKNIIAQITNPKLLFRKHEVMILQDPVSINIETPQSASSIVHTESMKFLKSFKITNPNFQQLLSLDDKTYQFLVTQLFKLNPYHGFLMSDILEASPPGYVQSVFNRILKTSTILDQTVRKQGQSLYTSLVKCEFFWFLSLVNMWREIEMSNQKLQFICSTQQAQKLRLHGWGKHILAVTVPHPLEIFREHKVKVGGGCDICQVLGNPDHLRINIENSLMKKPGSIREKVGPNAPYLGSETVEKNERVIGAAVVNLDSLIKRCLKLLRVIGWFVPRESHAAKLLCRLFG